MASHNNTSRSSTTTTTTTTTTPSLCSKGCGFYGSTATRDMCSKCYRDFLKESELDQLKLLTIAEKPTTTVGVDNLSTNGTTSTLRSESGIIINRKKSTTRCQCCNKRVGLTGFECRCGDTFCGLHRYPEEHACGFDFKAFGRAVLVKQNPLCNGDKMAERA